MENYDSVLSYLLASKTRLNQYPDLLDTKLLDTHFNAMQKELLEFLYSKNCDNDLAGIVSSLMHLNYHTMQVAAELGLNVYQWNECFKKVHEGKMDSTAKREIHLSEILNPTRYTR